MQMENKIIGSRFTPAPMCGPTMRNAHFDRTPRVNASGRFVQTCFWAGLYDSFNHPVRAKQY